MFLLFGTKSAEAVLALVTFVCHYCGAASSQRIIKRMLKFTLFFIPLFTVSTSYVVECSRCGGTTALTRQQATHGLEWAARERQAG